jgi:hypothetical protein
MSPVTVKIPESASAETKQLIEALVATQNKMVEAFNGDRQKLHALAQGTAKRDSQSQAEFDAKIDAFFDQKAGDVPDLGTAKEITPEQLVTRRQVYDIARVLKGGSLEDRLEKAVKAYAGLTDKAEQTLRRKLDANKKRFSPRPGGQKEGGTTKSTDQNAFDEMLRVAKDIGIKFGG